MVHPRLAPLVTLSWQLAGHVGLRPKTRLQKPFVPPVAVRLAGMLRNGEFDNLRFAFGRVHRDSQRTTIEAMLTQLDQDESIDQWMERLWNWYRFNRESQSRAVLIYGLVRQAWERRGSRWGRDVSDEQWAGFSEALEEAERLLEAALAAEPDHVDLMCLGLISARGLGLPIEEHWNRFRALIAVDPGHFRGHVSMLENLKAKWGGSDDAMFRFARARLAQAPQGSSLAALVVLAHFEMRNMRFWLGEADPDGYFREAGVGDEIEAAWLRSLGSPDYVDEKNAELLANLFAAALYLARRPEAARQALAMMNGHCLETPWRTMATTPKEKAHFGWIVDRVEQELGMPASA
ncbi:MAG: hypothetical protein H6R14_167 [Proteobacteria bacterium]|nr:hypothetical protein [Pseudomonadota bacterium]